MTSWASYAGARIVSGSVLIPLYGAMTADVHFADVTAVPSVASTLTVGDLIMAGTAVRTAGFAGARSARLVGGAGGWRRDVLARAYDVGVTVSMVLGDAATEVGELVAVTTDRSLGQWVREPGPASRVLAMLAGSSWWINAAGVTQVGTPRSALPITSPFVVMSRDGASGLVQIATDTFADWMPGRTFVAPTISTPLTVKMVRHHFDREGIARTEVLT